MYKLKINLVLIFCLLVNVLYAQKIDLASRSSDSQKFGTFYDSSAPDIGGTGVDEGRYVVFVSSATGLGDSLGKHRQIIWRDRNKGETVLVSVGLKGGEANGDSFSPSISADGMSVAFESYATDLVPIDTNKVRDVFVWNYRNKTIEAVSTGPGEIETNSDAYEPTISGDGKSIAYSSSASNITPGVEGTYTINVYLKDMSSHTTKLLSIDPKTKKGVGGSNPSISDDGSRVAFYSYSSKLVEGDKNDLWDIFLYDNIDPKLKRISLTANGGERNQGQESASRVVSPSISGNGKYVAFATTATNMVSGNNNKLQDVFVVNVDSGAMVLASKSQDGTSGNGDSPGGQGEKIAISYDGSRVAFTTYATNLGGNLLMRSFTDGKILVISSNLKSGVAVPAISGDGNFVVFGSNGYLDERYRSSGIFTSFIGQMPSSR